MTICIIGAGAMGALYGGLLAHHGEDVVLLDPWREHIDAINVDGLHLDGITGDIRIAVRAVTVPEDVGKADLAIIQVNTYDTDEAARAAAVVLKESGFVVSLQNGVGNLERLCSVLGTERVIGGLSYHSAEHQGPGHVTHTHAGPTWIGELDGRRTPRLEALGRLLGSVSFDPVLVNDIQGFIWGKFIHNTAINALCAVTGLRVGEIPRSAAADALQTKLIEEALAVVDAKDIEVPDADPMAAIKDFCTKKFNKPSMLQHMEQGKLTEVDALNGTVVREGRELGIPTPYNEALTMIVKAMEARVQRDRQGPVDYDKLEAEALAAASSGSGSC